MLTTAMLFIVMQSTVLEAPVEPAFSAETCNTLDSTTCVDHARAAQIIAREIGHPNVGSRDNLFGLFPAIFPGGYHGEADIAYPDSVATLEHVVVALVRWAGWDTVNYEKSLVDEVKMFADAEGFPFYKPSPSPRSVPYIIAAITAGLIDESDLPQLQDSISEQTISNLAQRAIKIADDHQSVLSSKPDKNFPGLSYPTDEARFALLEPGFRAYSELDDLPGSVLDLNGPEIRLFKPGSQLDSGRQTYFPLGPLETLFAAGLYVPEDNLSHQSQAIYGLVENASSTVNAVGVWGAGKSWEHDARVWGGFFVAESSEEDAQLVGLEVDVINRSLPGVAPNASKSGLHIVGIGDAPVTDAILIIGAEEAKWENGIMFESNSLTPTAALIAIGEGPPVARGIDLRNVRFTDSALALAKWSAITFQNTDGESSAILTDDSNRLIIRGGESGVRIVNTSGDLVAEYTPDGDLITRHGSVSDLFSRLEALEAKIAELSTQSPAELTE